MDPLVDALGLGVSLLACFATAAVGGRFTLASVDDWYAGLRKPAWVPSGRTIGAVWTVLYLLMAVAAWLVWRALGVESWAALLPFALQLVLNGAWSYLFFGRRDPRAALVELVALGASVLVTLVVFWTVEPLAGALLIPYLAWVTLAGTLNRAIVRMNP